MAAHTKMSNRRFILQFGTPEEKALVLKAVMHDLTNDAQQEPAKETIMEEPIDITEVFKNINLSLLHLRHQLAKALALHKGRGLLGVDIR